MKTSFSDRLKKFIEHLDMSVRQFEMHIGVSNGSIGKVLNHNTDLSKDTINKIATKFPILNLTWLITGSGDMLPIHKMFPSENTELDKLMESNLNEKEVIDKYLPKSNNESWVEEKIAFMQKVIDTQEALIEELKKK